MMAGWPCPYYRLNDLLRLTLSACDDTVDVLQASPDPEHQPRLLSQPASISHAVCLCCPGGKLYYNVWVLQRKM